MADKKDSGNKKQTETKKVQQNKTELTFLYNPKLPVYVSVIGWNSTSGSFSIAYADTSEFKYKILGKGTLAIKDEDKKDIVKFLIPEKVPELFKFTVNFQGLYSPHPGNKIISVDYIIIQGTRRETLSINEKVEAGAVKDYDHSVYFKAKEETEDDRI